MTATTIPVHAAVANGSIADPSATTVAAANGGTIPNADTEHLLLKVTATTAGNLVVKAGDYPPALAASLGDLTVAVGTSGTAWVGPFESGRFIQNDGSLSLTCTQDLAVTAFVLPKAA